MSGFTPLHFASKKGHVEAARYLITQHNCSPELGDIDGFTPLHSAASNGHLATLGMQLHEPLQEVERLLFDN